MNFKNLIVKVEDGIAIITFNRPKTLNALNREMYLPINSSIRPGRR